MRKLTTFQQNLIQSDSDESEVLPCDSHFVLVHISQNLEEVAGYFKIIHIVHRKRSVQQTFRCEHQQQPILQNMLILITYPQFSKMLTGSIEMRNQVGDQIDVNQVSEDKNSFKAVSDKFRVDLFSEDLKVNIEDLLEDGAVVTHQLFVADCGLPLRKLLVDLFPYFHLLLYLLILYLFLELKCSSLGFSCHLFPLF